MVDSAVFMVDSAFASSIAPGRTRFPVGYGSVS